MSQFFPGIGKNAAELDAEQEVIWAPPGKAPAKLVAGVNWWLNSDPAHAEDPVAMMVDNQDALILTGLNDVLGVAWVDPEGTVRELRGKFQLVHIEEDEETAEAIKVSADIDTMVDSSRQARYAAQEKEKK